MMNFLLNNAIVALFKYEDLNMKSLEDQVIFVGE